MTGKYALTMNEFQWKQKVQLLQQSHELTDVTLVSKDKKKIKAHKIILSMSSAFFREVLTDNAHPHPLLFLGGVEYEVLRAIVDFLYLSKVEVKQDLLQSFLDTALALEIDGLDSKSEDVALENNEERPKTFLRTGKDIKQDKMSEKTFQSDVKIKEEGSLNINENDLFNIMKYGEIINNVKNGTNRTKYKTTM